MTDTTQEKALAAKLAEELIASIKAKVAPRATALEDRITKALDYVDKVETPNAYTLTHIRRFLEGEYDTFPFSHPAPTVRDLFARRWDCRVVSTGYNNGAGCDPSDPHGPDWRCGYLWQASLTDKQAKEYGMVPLEEVEGTAT